jgi:hypothetical protein
MKKSAGRMLRDNFTLLPEERALIEKLELRFGRECGLLLNKSEVVRAGLYALNSLRSQELEKVGELLPRVRRGPEKGTKARP